MITLQDLSKELGVSIATVSNAISGKGRMREEKRRDIVKAAKELGYDFSNVESRQRKKTIYIIAEQIGVKFSDDIIKGICAAAEEANTCVSIYNLNLVVKKNGFNPDEASLKELTRRVINTLGMTASGIIYVSQYPRDLTNVLPQLPYPFVCAYCYTKGLHPCVNYDDAQGAYIATEHLIKSGCHRIAMISGPINSIPMTKRLTGYQRALVDNGLPFDPQLVQLGAWSFESGYACTKALLANTARPDAVFCQSDHIAIGAIRAIKESGLRIPQDCAVIGFDDYDFGTTIEPSLTTIAPPCFEIGQSAFGCLWNMINTRSFNTQSVKINCSLIKRESTR